MPTSQEIARSLRQAITETERELGRLRGALSAIEGTDLAVTLPAGPPPETVPDESPVSPPSRIRLRRTKLQLTRLRQLVLTNLKEAEGRGTVPQVHAALVKAGELQDSRSELEVVRNLFRGLEQMGRVKNEGRGHFVLTWDEEEERARGA
jgi:hypothetical protein